VANCGEHNVAIVTGGCKGIGAGIVAAYRKLGWAVVLVVRPILGRGHIVNITATLAEYGDPSTPAVLAAVTKGPRRGDEDPRHRRRPVSSRQPLHPPESYVAQATRTPVRTSWVRSAMWCARSCSSRRRRSSPARSFTSTVGAAPAMFDQCSPMVHLAVDAAAAG
jgi:hypothetical protein